MLGILAIFSLIHGDLPRLLLHPVPTVQEVLLLDLPELEVSLDPLHHLCDPAVGPSHQEVIHTFHEDIHGDITTNMEYDNKFNLHCTADLVYFKV